MLVQRDETRIPGSTEVNWAGMKLSQQQARRECDSVEEVEVSRISGRAGGEGERPGSTTAKGIQGLAESKSISRSPRVSDMHKC